MSLQATSTPPASAPRSRRRRILPYALLAAALVAVALACTQTTPPQPGGVSGTYDLARVGHYVFVTSADLSELRVIDAHADGGPNDTGPHDWVRAPNPLEALEIPVAQRPVGLARDLNYTVVGTDDPITPVGGEVTGPYVYAFADGRSEISVVNADPTTAVESLVELQRLTTDGPVTAASAMGPSGPVASSTLFYATLVGGTGNLYSVTLPPPDQLVGQAPAPRLLMRMNPGEAISALQVLPLHQEVAVATRSTDAQQKVVGRAFTLQPSSGVLRPMSFGAPLRILATHPGTKGDDVFQPKPPEENLFGLVDEESCGGAGTAGCARVLTVDINSGQPALDFTGQPALPIEFGRGLPRALTFMANMQVKSSQAPGGLADLPLMGLVTNTDGTLTFFEAIGRPELGTEVSPDPDAGVPAPIAPQWTLRHVNQGTGIGAGSNFFYEDQTGTAIQTPPQGGCGSPPDGGPAPQGIQLCSIVAGFGDSVGQAVLVTFEGFLPGLTALPTSDADGQTFPLPAGAPGNRVEIGDRIVVTLGDGTACPDLTVTSTSATSLSTTDLIPPGCVGRTSFGVRAADPTPYVVTGQLSGYMGRARDEATFESPPGRVYYRPDPKVRDPALPPPPELTFQMAVRPGVIARDYRWAFLTSNGFATLFFELSTDSTGWPGYHLPYGVVAMPDVPRIFLSYPSVSRTVLLGSGAVIELNPTTIFPNEANVTISSAYR